MRKIIKFPVTHNMCNYTKLVSEEMWSPSSGKITETKLENKICDVPFRKNNK